MCGTSKKTGSEYLYYGNVWIGGVGPNVKHKGCGSPHEGWFWFADSTGDLIWQAWGVWVPRSSNYDLKLPRKQDAKDQCLAYCKEYIIVRQDENLMCPGLEQEVDTISNR